MMADTHPKTNPKHPNVATSPIPKVPNHQSARPGYDQQHTADEMPEDCDLKYAVTMDTGDGNQSG